MSNSVKFTISHAKTLSGRGDLSAPRTYRTDLGIDLHRQKDELERHHQHASLDINTQAWKTTHASRQSHRAFIRILAVESFRHHYGRELSSGKVREELRATLGHLDDIITGSSHTDAYGAAIKYLDRMRLFV